MIKQSTSNPWHADSLFAKSCLYIEQMEVNNPNDWQYGLWSALCLELLARASLAKVSPVLLADAKNWKNIAFALGHADIAKKFTPTSIPTSEVFNRLEELLPDFTNEMKGFCLKHINDRNAELHTGEGIYHNYGTSNWLPRFYQVCDIFLVSLGKRLGDFINNENHATSLIKSLGDETAKSVRQDINAYAKVWSKKNKAEKDLALSQAKLWATRQKGHRVECPSCSATALLQGVPFGTVTTDTDSNTEVIQKQSMQPSSFECIACGLKISGFSKLSSCELGDFFIETTAYTTAEYFELYTEDDLEEARSEGWSEAEASLSYEPDFNEY